MEDISSIHSELIEENSFLKQRIKELEQLEAERKRVEGESRRLASVVRHSRELVNLSTPDGTMVFLNDAGKKMLGISEEDIAQTNIMQVIPEHLHDKVRHEVLSYIEKDGYWEGDLQYLNLKTGGLTDVHAITYKITDPYTAELQFLANVSLDISDRKRAEESLQKGELKFRAIVETAPLAIILTVGIEQTTEYINPMFIKLFGYGLEDIPAVEKWWPLAYPDETYRRQISEEWTQRVKRAIETQSPIEPMEVVVTCKDGSKKNISWGYITMGDKNYACGLDLTEHRHAEEALKLSEQKYRNIYVNAMVGIFHSTPDGKYLRVNPALAAIHGFSSSDEMINTVTNIGEQLYVNPEDRKRYMDLLKKTDVIRNFEAQLYRKDRSMVWISMNVQVLRHPDGSVAYYEGIVEDITSRKQAEKALQESEERFKQVALNANELIWEVDADGIYRYCSLAVERILGYSPDELVGQKHFYDLFAPDVREELKEKAFATFQREEPFLDLVNPNVHKNGSIVIMETSGTPFMDNEGNLMGYRGADTDITSRKLAEEDLKKTMEKLRKSLAGSIQAMSLTVETRDPYTAGHQRKVSNLARTIAQEMGLSNDTVDTIRMAGIIHDIGKISIPAEILSKPTKLTDMEFSLIKAHSQTGYDILKDVGLPYPIAEIAYQHHERLDGSGYPQKLKGEDIFLEAKILAVADVVEAISSHRPYRPGLGIDVALEEIQKNKGILYDENVVEVCLKLFREKGFVFEPTVS